MVQMHKMVYPFGQPQKEMFNGQLQVFQHRTNLFKEYGDLIKIFYLETREIDSKDEKLHLILMNMYLKSQI